MVYNKYMNILYCGISSKYIHTMPAGWFLCEYVKSKGIEINEMYFNVNQAYEQILDTILTNKPSKLLFSVYIFNVSLIKRLIKDIKSKLEQCKIIVGGPEVDDNFYADHVIIGEGEEALYQLLRNGSNEKILHEKCIENLDLIPSPYNEQRIKQSKNKLIYYESTRGCPFNCTYCMASLSRGVRYFSIGRVKTDLINLVRNGVKVIKFTDRTFNANIKRTNEILNFILEQFYDDEVCFHLEVGGDIFTQTTLDILKKMPIGRIQMEAGVQTLNKQSLKAIKRDFRVEDFTNNINKIIGYGNIHMHLDLIAGLPFDTMQTFVDSFNQVIALKPHVLQLGFLKFLKKTELRKTYKAEYNEYPPYEIISSDTMSEQDLHVLKDVEFILDRLYNSGKFVYTMNYLLSQAPSAFSLFYELGIFFKQKGVARGASESLVYATLLEYYEGKYPFIKDLLKFDYLLTNNSKRLYPAIKSKHVGECKRFLAQHKRTKFVMYECFDYNPVTRQKGLSIIKFDYSRKNAVTNQYDYCFI